MPLAVLAGPGARTETPILQPYYYRRPTDSRSRSRSRSGSSKQTNKLHIRHKPAGMSFFAGGGSGSGGHKNSHGSSHHKSSGNFFSPSSSRPSYPRSTSSSIFSRAGGGSSSSYYKRRPRDGYIAYLLAKLKRLIADLWTYARRHPMKAFFAVVVPLISAGGALHGLLKQFGIRLPAAFDGTSRTVRGGYYGSGGYSGSSEFGGGMGAMGNLFKIAQAFM